MVNMNKKFTSPKDFLEYLNVTYSDLHTKYESLFWVSYMYDHSIDQKKDIAMKMRDSFRANVDLLQQVREYKKIAKGKIKERLSYWEHFFTLYQTPPQGLVLKDQIATLESKIQKTRTERKQGYIDPKTKKFVEKSVNEIKNLLATADDESVRKACFDALQVMNGPLLDDFVALIKLRNEYANLLGYEDFYAYKLEVEEGMTKKDLFIIFDTIYDQTKYGFQEIRILEKTQKGLRKPWNFGYMIAGSFTKEEDPFYPFEEALDRWGRSFKALGIDFKGGSLTLDLLERNGKYNNGFCHWPKLVSYTGEKRIPGVSNFTCNVSLGQSGEEMQGFHTLFHEGGHAAHMLNTDMKDVCLNHEYAPMSTAWAETQSMFLDNVYSSIEWRVRYAKTLDGASYPFELFERKVEALHPVAPLRMMSIMMVMYFEKSLYEEKNISTEKVRTIAKKVFLKYSDRSEASLSLLETPHIYAWESSCSYQGYGLAELALSQWREYFYKKYGYIVDNPNIGKEMAKVWKLGASKTFPELVKIATGKKLTPNAYIKSITGTIPQKIARAKKRIQDMEKIKPYTKDVVFDASIRMVDGKKEIANNKKGFKHMSDVYKKWLKQKRQS